MALCNQLACSFDTYRHEICRQTIDYVKISLSRMITIAREFERFTDSAREDAFTSTTLTARTARCAPFYLTKPITTSDCIMPAYTKEVHHSRPKTSTQKRYARPGPRSGAITACQRGSCCHWENQRRRWA